MMEFQFHTFELVELRRRPGRRSRLGAAVARFLTKLAFFGVMCGLGLAGMAWLPPTPDPPAMTLGDVVNLVVGFCAALMWLMGLMGLVVALFTAGRKPLWD